MNVLKPLLAVMTMQLATTFKGVTPALATLDTQGMDLHALVSSLVLCSTHNFEQILSLIARLHQYLSISHFVLVRYIPSGDMLMCGTYA